MTHRLLTAMLFLVLLVVGFSTLSAQDQTVQITHAEVETIPANAEDAPQPIADGEATLYTDENGATMVFMTSDLVPGNVYTAWWVIMNNPEVCASTPCTPEDVIGNAAEVGTQITFADSLIADETGQATFAGHLPAGEIADGWYNQTFDDPMSAEIHIVINDHGPRIETALVSMLSSYRGGCTDESLPEPFPDSAKADGVAGRNACALVQDAIFVQTP
jgi:hypothetical protein